MEGETAEESESTVATAPVPTIQKDVTGKETGSDGDPTCATARGEEEGVNLSKLTLGDTVEENTCFWKRGRRPHPHRIQDR